MSLIGPRGEFYEGVQSERVFFPSDFNTRDERALDWKFEYFLLPLSV
jgi:hypothetical protein